MKTYDKYINTSLAGINEVPHHWKSIKLKFIGNLYSGLSGKSGDDFYNPDAPLSRPYISFKNIAGNSKINPTQLDYVIINPEDVQNKVKIGDLFFLMSSENFEDIGKAAVLDTDLEETYLNSFCRGFRINVDSFNPSFLNYLLSSGLYRQMMSIEAKGFTRINIQVGKIQNFQIFAPFSFEEQTKIAQYLDYQTSTIEKIIQQKEKLIELLKQKRQAVINEAVAKGLNPKAKMKDSGVEWLGEMPMHWNFMPLKYLSSKDRGIQTGPFGTQLNTKDYIDYGIKVLNQKTLIDEDYNSGEEYISSEKMKELPGYEVVGGDIIIGTRGSFGAKARTTFGKCSIVPDNIPESVLHPCLIRIRLNEDFITKNYFKYYVNDSTHFLEHLLNTSNSTTIEVIYGVTLKSIKFPVPPISEQNDIVQYLDRIAGELDKIVSLELMQIDRLKEYSQSLISEAVTGKIDVREWQPNKQQVA